MLSVTIALVVLAAPVAPDLPQSSAPLAPDLPESIAPAAPEMPQSTAPVAPAPPQADPSADSAGTKEKPSDSLLLVLSLAVPATLAALLVLLGGFPWRAPRPALVSLGWVLGVGFGFFAGCRLLGLWPHWLPQDVATRLVYFLFPAVIAVEAMVSFSVVPRWLAWLLRLGIAAEAAPILLHNTIYLANLAGPGSREWTPQQTWLILGSLAVALAVLWAALALLAERRPGPRALPLVLALACAGAALSVLLSGYASGGAMGLPLAAGLVGASVASIVLPGSHAIRGALGLGVAGLFSLLVMGHFFGHLTATHAVLLFAAPLFCWLPALPGVDRLCPWLRGFLMVGLVMVPVLFVVLQARQQFVADSQTTASGARETTADDYAQFGK